MNAIILFIVFLTLYVLYQWARNEKIYTIRIKWLQKDDSRRKKYSYDQMLFPNLKNWFGFRWPMEKTFKN